MIEPTKHSVSVAGIVVNDLGHVLLIQRHDNGHWEPPGGVLELHETIDAGVRREILEETGIIVEVGLLTGVYKNMELGVVALVFRCSEVGGSVQTSAETSAVEWIDPGRLSALMAPAYAIRVLDALRNSSRAHVRAHDGTELMPPG